MESEDVKAIAHHLHVLLGEYIQIHNSLFKFTLRRILPLPFLFEAIDYRSLHSRLDVLCGEMQVCKDQLNIILASSIDLRYIPFVECLLEYCEYLLNTLVTLKEVVYQLYLKGQGQRYDWTSYKEQLASYNEYVAVYKAIGGRLNTLYRQATGESE